MTSRCKRNSPEGRIAGPGLVSGLVLAIALAACGDSTPAVPSPVSALPATSIGAATTMPQPMATATATPSPTYTSTPTDTPSATPTAIPPTPVPTDTPTALPTPSPTATASPTPSPLPPAIDTAPLSPTPVPATPGPPVDVQPVVPAYRFVPMGPAQPDHSHPCPGCPRAPGYITGRVIDAGGNPLPGVRLVCYNDWHRYPVVASKGSGEYDFPILQAEAIWYVMVLNEADQPLSAEAPVSFSPQEACWYRLDWQRTD